MYTVGELRSKVFQPVYRFSVGLFAPDLWVNNVCEILGYQTFGDNTYSPILCNLPHSGVITIIMKLLIATHVLCAYPILMNVLCQEMEVLLLPETTKENQQRNWWLSNVIRNSI